MVCFPMRRSFPIAVIILLFALIAMVVWISNHLDFKPRRAPAQPVRSETKLSPPPSAGLLIDRWGSPLIVHHKAWRQLEPHSAGPDRIPHNGNDLVLSPAGVS
jgi:hypothetical protein